MKEYIERSEALRLMDTDIANRRARFKDDKFMNLVIDTSQTTRDFVTLVPAADVVERKRGEWVDVVYNPVWGKMKATCNSCQCRGEVRVKSNYCGFAVPDSNFCPNCGADMSGAEDGK